MTGYGCLECSQLTSGRCWRHASETVILGPATVPMLCARCAATDAAHAEEVARLTKERDQLRADLTRMDCDWPDFEAMRAEVTRLRAELAAARLPVRCVRAGCELAAPEKGGG